MADLFGFAAGMQARQQNDRQQMLAELAVRQGDAQIRQSNVETASAELALQGQEKMIELMKQKEALRADSANGPPVPGAGTAEGEDIPNSLDELAHLALQSGLPQQAAEYASKASTLRTNASEIRQRNMAERIQKLTFASNVLATVGDESAWRQANALYTMTFGEKSPFAQMSYSPELVAKLQDSIVSQKDRAVADAANARATASLAAARADEARVPLINAQRRLADARATALRKVGGKPPPAQDLKAVSDLIASEFMGAVTPEDARILARPVAERMQQIIQSSEGLSRSEAARRAFEEARQRGDFGGLRPRRQMKGSAANPREMPATQAELKPNMYYKPTTGKYAGKTLLWNGKAFQVVQPSQIVEAEAELDDELGESNEEGFDNEHTKDTDEGY